MPVYIERGVLALDRVYVNGRARGFLIGIAPADSVLSLAPRPVDVGVHP
jgi:prolyl-tRNA editing enzyme YbaK/EbsC (Cys-tRNA(Pro) deacylase)